MAFIQRRTRKAALEKTEELYIATPSSKGLPTSTNLSHVGRVETFMMDYHSLTPKRYSYSDITKMTNSFVNTLGEGGFGNVYRGKLPYDGRLVAVKVLKSPKVMEKSS
ncbi:hypothetical protein NC653_038815 [Populus alba x Populus x berolinensis]|uniref:Protein kinase domain-containing protein n=1 Tax=Populus alba x Populus x berolinensis TaxID=444605 RepID=A0AAD6LHX6_9ROSI|nr:hypothetical protein NC653_038815 [Populus alba x Populus x berolinensis]